MCFQSYDLLLDTCFNINRDSIDDSYDFFFRKNLEEGYLNKFSSFKNIVRFLRCCKAFSFFFFLLFRNVEKINLFQEYLQTNDTIRE